ncbi:hypothetical protein DFP72DRAFT_1049537 [Ephemerocybe angulata]|uniref:Uncharacterized protein n=1 Tax=Ephemerocybe angulata TaxID=980116 RepID=A0A8H6HLF2_9AGAR|nr:hypothetical protein DFP72DRAFT_1049537 [Tulosesus angulatus]
MGQGWLSEGKVAGRLQLRHGILQLGDLGRKSGGCRLLAACIGKAVNLIDLNNVDSSMTGGFCTRVAGTHNDKLQAILNELIVVASSGFPAYSSFFSSLKTMTRVKAQPNPRQNAGSSQATFAFWHYSEASQKKYGDESSVYWWRKTIPLFHLLSLPPSSLASANTGVLLRLRVQSMDEHPANQSLDPRSNRPPQACLLRSGGLPISWSLSCAYEPDEGVSRRANVLEALQLLTAQSHRWQTIALTIRTGDIIHLASIKGKVPELSKLVLRLLKGDSQSSPIPEFDYFLDSPVLKNVDITTTDSPTQPIRILLPLTRLESFSARDCDSGALTSSILPPPYSTHITLSRLEALRLHITSTGPLSPLLGLLILPSLTDLEIRGWHDAATSIYDIVFELLRRSGCSLARLSLDSNLGEHPIALSHIFSYCTELTNLELSDIGSEGFRQLILSGNSPNHVLPKLKRLTLRCTARGGPIIPGIFMLAFRARADALSQYNRAAGLRPIEEARLLFEDDVMLHHQMTLFEDEEIDTYEHTSPVDVEYKSLASKARRYLNTKFFMQGEARAIDHANLSLHAKMHKLMSQLERIDLRTNNSNVLMRRGIPSLLHSVAISPAGSVPGDRIFKFRQRAKALCDKWKPFLVRDIRSFPYRWIYTTPGEAILRYHDPSNDDFMLILRPVAAQDVDKIVEEYLGKRR